MHGKLLKGVGLALIAMPEPFTTPLGLGIIAASWIISRHHDARKRAHVRHIVKEYLKTYRPFGYGMDYVPKTSANLPYRDGKALFGSRNRTVLSFAPARSAISNLELKPVFHVFDPGLISKRFDGGGTRRGFEGYWGRQTELDIGKVIHHTLRMAPVSLS